ncbi:MAG: hypothetical protein AAB393_15295, partial [Bacteroidota bacterium]
MKRSSLFGHVIELHDAIIISKRPADVVTTEFFRARHYLGSKDRRFISEMVFGLIRNFKLLTVYAQESMAHAGHRRDQRATPAIVFVAA